MARQFCEKHTRKNRQLLLTANSLTEASHQNKCSKLENNPMLKTVFACLMVPRKKKQSATYSTRNGGVWRMQDSDLGRYVICVLHRKINQWNSHWKSNLATYSQKKNHQQLNNKHWLKIVGLFCKAPIWLHLSVTAVGLCFLQWTCTSASCLNFQVLKAVVSL